MSGTSLRRPQITRHVMWGGRCFIYVLQTRCAQHTHNYILHVGVTVWSMTCLSSQTCPKLISFPFTHHISNFFGLIFFLQRYKRYLVTIPANSIVNLTGVSYMTISFETFRWLQNWILHTNSTFDWGLIIRELVVVVAVDADICASGSCSFRIPALHFELWLGRKVWPKI